MVSIASRSAEFPDTWSEAYRHECEVRYVKALAPERKAEYLRGVQLHRGEAAARKLEKDSERKATEGK